MVASSGSFLFGERVGKLLATVVTVHADIEIERQMFGIECDRLPKPFCFPTIQYCLEWAVVDMYGDGFAGVFVDADNRDDATEIENTCDTHANGFHGISSARSARLNALPFWMGGLDRDAVAGKT
jgi:hypothetical protein